MFQFSSFFLDMLYVVFEGQFNGSALFSRTPLSVEAERSCKQIKKFQSHLRIQLDCWSCTHRIADELLQAGFQWPNAKAHFVRPWG